MSLTKAAVDTKNESQGVPKECNPCIAPNLRDILKLPRSHR